MKRKTPTTTSQRTKPVVYQRHKKTEVTPDSFRFVVTRDKTEAAPDLTVEAEREQETAEVPEQENVYTHRGSEPAAPKDVSAVPESLQTYLRQIGRIALLGKDGEQAVAKRLDEAEPLKTVLLLGTMLRRRMGLAHSRNL